MASLTQLNRAPDSDSRFAQTVWGDVNLARQGDATPREMLVKRYWYPLYVYLRRRGQTREDAQDLLQVFLANLMERPDLGAPDASRGRFRTFLLTRLDSFVRDEWRKSQAVKRGRGREFVSWDALQAESSYAQEPRDVADPAKLFERAWARQILTEARELLRAKWAQGSRAQYFALLEPTLEGASTDLSYADIAAWCNTSEGAVKKTVHDLRKAYRQHLLELLSSERSVSQSTKDGAVDLQEFYAALAS